MKFKRHKKQFYKNLLKQNKKYCPSCCQIRNLTQFYNSKLRKSQKEVYCKFCFKSYTKKYFKRNKKIHTKWKLKNPNYYNNYMKQRRKNTCFKLKHNLRVRISQAIKYNYKALKTMFLVGCCKDYLMYYLQQQFKKGMTWDNYGLYGWHIDHIKPCASFDLSKPEEQSKCFNYTNLQPLWAKDNLSKGQKFKRKSYND